MRDWCAKQIDYVCQEMPEFKEIYVKVGLGKTFQEKMYNQVQASSK